MLINNGASIDVRNERGQRAIELVEFSVIKRLGMKDVEEVYLKHMQEQVHGRRKSIARISKERKNTKNLDLT